MYMYYCIWYWKKLIRYRNDIYSRECIEKKARIISSSVYKNMCNSMNEILLLLLLAIYFPFIPILPFVVVIGRLPRLWGIHIFSVYIYSF